jgi:hypothetical protein
MFPPAENFYNKIDQMIAKSFNFNLTSAARLDNIVPGSQLDLQQIIQQILESPDLKLGIQRIGLSAIIWDFAPEDILGYERIYILGYERI